MREYKIPTQILESFEAQYDPFDEKRLINLYQSLPLEDQEKWDFETFKIIFKKERMNVVKRYMKLNKYNN